MGVQVVYLGHDHKKHRLLKQVRQGREEGQQEVLTARGDGLNPQQTPGDQAELPGVVPLRATAWTFRLATHTDQHIPPRTASERDTGCHQGAGTTQGTSGMDWGAHPQPLPSPL